MEIPGEWGKGEWSQRPKQSKENSGGGGEGDVLKIPSVEEVWIFCGTTPCQIPLLTTSLLYFVNYNIVGLQDYCNLSSKKTFTFISQSRHAKFVLSGQKLFR